MGLALRLNAFRDVEAEHVYGALATFHAQRGAVLVPERDRQRCYDLYERRGPWCVLEWDAGWEWKLRREAQLHVSRQLGVPGVLVFVYDGDYWGYELFDRGEVVDQFVQVTWDAPVSFPDRDTRGDPAVLARTLGLPETEVAPYLLQWHSWPDRSKTGKERARPGDEFVRGDEAAVIDFLRALRVDVRLDGFLVEFGAPVWRSFRPSY